MSDAVFALFTDGIVRRQADADDPACVHAGFFIGSGALYAGLTALPPERRRHVAMTRISFVNTLFGAEARKRRQRRKACFVNETMMVTLLGSAISDALGDGRVVSGIGGQFDFVAMAAALEDARSLLMLRAWRMNRGRPESNIRWNYPHTSVPRQHRDVYVSEYGLADTRGRPDAAVIQAVLGIADARFQPALAADAVRAGKLPRDFRIDADLAGNSPAALAAAFEPPEIAQHFPPYPLGTDLDADEQALAAALGWLGDATAGRAGRLKTVLRAALAPVRAENHAGLDRMGLAGHSGGWLQRRLVNLALEETR
jgi:acyl-CoA hydrolase